jgi:signal transduction histidine kinase
MAFTSVNIAELVNNSTTAQRERFREKRVDLVATVSPEEPQVWADPQRLAQVLGNLIENALRHTPPGGRVDVSARTDHDEVTLRVADTGEGIPTEHLPHLFERFYRVDAARNRDHGGAGIGLAIAKALVEAHGGRITATSDGPGRGAAFTISLPLTSSREAPASW